ATHARRHRAGARADDDGAAEADAGARLDHAAPRSAQPADEARRDHVRRSARAPLGGQRHPPALAERAARSLDPRLRTHRIGPAAAHSASDEEARRGENGARGMSVKRLALYTALAFLVAALIGGAALVVA